MINLALWQQYRIGIFLKILYQVVCLLIMVVLLGYAIVCTSICLKKHSLSLRATALQTKIKLFHKKGVKDHNCLKNCLAILNKLSDLPEEVFLDRIRFRRQKISLTGTTADELLLQQFLRNLQIKISGMHWQYSTIKESLSHSKKFTAELNWHGG